MAGLDYLRRRQRNFLRFECLLARSVEYGLRLLLWQRLPLAEPELLALRDGATPVLAQLEHAHLIDVKVCLASGNLAHQDGLELNR